MASRRLRFSSSTGGSQNSAENTLVQSERPEREHTPGQSDPNSPNMSSTAANQGWKVGTMHDDGRLRIEVIARLLEPSGRCSRVITENFCERVDTTGFNWKAVSKDTKDFYWQEFKKSFAWKQDDKVIYKAWFVKASKRYSNFCSDARKKWEKGEIDNRVPTQAWLQWVEFWKTPNFQVKSVTQKRNRKGGADHYLPTHTGGSASLRTHAAKLAVAYNKDPTPADVYLYAHTLNHDKQTFINTKAEEIYKKIEELRAQRSEPLEGSSEPQVVDEDQLFLDAVGGPDARNRIYGMGSLQSVIYGAESSAISCYSSSNNEDYHHMQVELQEMKDRVQELQEMRNQELQDMRNEMNEMKNQLAMVLSSRNAS